MTVKPPKIGLRPKFGIGILIGVLLVLTTQGTGNDSAFAMVLGGGVGIALGLTRRKGRIELAAEGEESKG